MCEYVCWHGFVCVRLTRVPLNLLGPICRYCRGECLVSCVYESMMMVYVLWLYLWNRKREERIEAERNRQNKDIEALRQVRTYRLTM